MPRDSRPPWPPDEPDPRRPWIDPNPRPGKPNGLDTANPPRFQFTRFRDIKPSTDPAYVVDKLIPRLGVTVIWGRPKSGKTFWAFDLEMHVALGWPYRGRDVEQGEVLHIVCEAGWSIGARKEAWWLHHIEGMTAAEIAVIDSAPFHLCKETALDLIKDADTVVAEIFKQFGYRQIRIITIDTLNRSLRGSENKDEDMSAYIRAATLLAEKFSCAVVIVHHSGHNEERPRGHSSLLGAVDALIQIKKDAQGLVHSEVEEMRDGPTGDTTVSRLKAIDVIQDKRGRMITSCVLLDAPEAAAQPQSSPSGKMPSPMAQRYYEALTNVAADMAQNRPSSHGKPSITEKQWRTRLQREGLIPPLPAGDADKDVVALSPKVRNQRNALVSKYRRELIAANWIRCNDDAGIIWSIRERG